MEGLAGEHVKEAQIKRSWFIAAVGIAAAAVLIAVGFAVRFQSLEAESRQQDETLRAEVTALEEQLETAEARIRELQDQLDQETGTNQELQGQLEAALREAQEAREALQRRLTAEAEARRNAASAYSGLYPELYAEPADLESLAPENTIYLTFDDGPSARTAEILDILKENGIKATFFVTGKTGEEAQTLMRRIVEEGHTIAIHTYTHKYKSIYASVQAYLDDFNKIYTYIHEVTGVYPQIFRFPGGSNTGYNRRIRSQLIAEMDRRGFVHYDWNALNGDAEGKPYTEEEMKEYALRQLGVCHVIMLMHDAADKTKTVACLPDIIAAYRDAGYTFAPLRPEIKAITFA